MMCVDPCPRNLFGFVSPCDLKDMLSKKRTPTLNWSMVTQVRGARHNKRFNANIFLISFEEITKYPISFIF